MLKIIIIIPTYNEAKNIVKLTNLIDKQMLNESRCKCEILIVDDSSPDKTAAIIKKQKFKNISLSVLERKEKDGFGRAYIAGFKHSLKKNYDYILQMDADLSHNPKYLKKFIDYAVQDYDFVVGSRYVKGGSTPDWSINRRILSKGGNLYARIFIGSKITDYTGGYNMYKTSIIKGILENSGLNSAGYGFLIELKFKALKRSKKIAQIPIVFLDRQHGISKIPKSTLFRNLILVIKLRF